MPNAWAKGLLVAWLSGCCSLSLAAEEIRVVRKLEFGTPEPPTATHRFELRLSVAVLRGAGWEPEAVGASVRRAVALLAPCDVGTPEIQLFEIEAPARYRTLLTPVSRRLAAELDLPRPAVFFVADTRQRPAFDAEAIGRGNSRTRPEMADTVWIVRGARDLEIAIAHELVHVLADSGEHADAPGNLMNEDTSPGATRLTEAQCSAMTEKALANGLLRRRTPPR